MRNLFQKLWNDDAGIAGMEYLFLGTIVGLGLVIGFAAVESALNTELIELANAITSLNQSYSVEDQSSCKATKGGQNVIDTATTQAWTSVPSTTVSNIDVAVCP